MQVDSSVLYRTLTTTATNVETVFDPSIGAEVLRKDGQLKYCTIDSSVPQMNGKINRPSTHLYADSSAVENMFSRYNKTTLDQSWYYTDRYETLNERIIKAREKFEN